MTAKDYAAAVISVSQKGNSDAQVISALVRELKRKGETKLMPSILAQLKRGLARTHKLASRVEVAHKRDEKAALRAASELGIDADSAHVNPLLVSGWRALANGTLIDRSGKNELVKLYRSVTR